MASKDQSDALFSDNYREHLLELLDNIPGKKNLVLQKSLVGQIEHFATFSVLKEHGVDRIFFLENNNVDSSQKNVLFLSRGEKPDHIQAVASKYRAVKLLWKPLGVESKEKNSSISHDISVCWVPRRTLLSDRLLSDAGVLGEVSVLELPISLQQVEPDLLSLELDESCADLYLHKDTTSVFLAAKALANIQQQHGLFPQLLGKGVQADRLISLLKRMRAENTATYGDSVNGVPKKSALPSATFESLIVIDRAVDFASPLLTQLTYTGLIDEIFGIDHSQLEVETSIIGTLPNSNREAPSQSSQSTKRKIRLTNNRDKLYASLCDTNFAIVGSILNGVARRLQSTYEGRHTAQTTAELSDFVKKLPGYQAEQESLKIHTALAEHIMKNTRGDTFSKVLEIQQNLIAGAESGNVYEMIEDLIAKNTSIETVLRLLCLASVVGRGLRSRDLVHFHTLVTQAYGYQHLLTLDALEGMGILTAREGVSIPGSGFFSSGTPAPSHSILATTAASTTNYSSVRRPLHLIVDDVSDESPTDIAYVYSGYAPLSVRLVQCIIQPSYLSSLSATRISGKSGNVSMTSTQDSEEQSTIQSQDAHSTLTWRKFESSLTSVAGPTIEDVQANKSKAAQSRRNLEGRSGGASGPGPNPKTTLVFFVGGITYAEVAALRFVAERCGRKLLIGTTSLIRGNSLIEGAMQISKTPRG